MSPSLRADVEDFFLPPPAAESSDVTQLYEQGLSLARQQKWSEGLAFFEQIVRQQPQQLEALHMAGVCLWQQGGLPRAQRFLVLASRHPRPDPATYMALSALHAGATNLLESAGWLRKGLRELDEPARLRWIVHPSLETLWIHSDPAFRSVLAEFALPSDRAEALVQASAAAVPSPPASPALPAESPGNVYDTGLRLNDLPADPEARARVTDALRDGESAAGLPLPAPRLDTTGTAAETP